MKKGTVVNLGRLKSVIDFLKTNWCLLTLTAAFIFGLTFGTLNSNADTNFADFCEKITQSFIETRHTGDFLKIFKCSFLINFSFLIAVFIFGASITGVTLVPIIMFLRGLLFGALASVIYASYTLNGISFNALILIPPSVISVIFLILLSQSAMKLSLYVISITLPTGTPTNLSFIFNKYWKQHLILIIPIVLAALLDAWLSVKLINYFILI